MDFPLRAQSIVNRVYSHECPVAPSKLVQEARQLCRVWAWPEYCGLPIWPLPPTECPLHTAYRSATHANSWGATLLFGNHGLTGQQTHIRGWNLLLSHLKCSLCVVFPRLAVHPTQKESGQPKALQLPQGSCPDPSKEKQSPQTLSLQEGAASWCLRVQEQASLSICRAFVPGPLAETRTPGCSSSLQTILRIHGFHPRWAELTNSKRGAWKTSLP